MQLAHAVSLRTGWIFFQTIWYYCLKIVYKFNKQKYYLEVNKNYIKYNTIGCNEPEAVSVIMIIIITIFFRYLFFLFFFYLFFFFSPFFSFFFLIMPTKKSSRACYSKVTVFSNAMPTPMNNCFLVSMNQIFPFGFDFRTWNICYSGDMKRVVSNKVKSYSIIWSCTLSIVMSLRLRANGRNIVGQQLPTLLHVTCCVLIPQEVL